MSITNLFHNVYYAVMQLVHKKKREIVISQRTMNNNELALCEECSETYPRVLGSCPFCG